MRGDYFIVQIFLHSPSAKVFRKPRAGRPGRAGRTLFLCTEGTVHLQHLHRHADPLRRHLSPNVKLDTAGWRYAYMVVSFEIKARIINSQRIFRNEFACEITCTVRRRRAGEQHALYCLNHEIKSKLQRHKGFLQVVVDSMLILHAQACTASDAPKHTSWSFPTTARTALALALVHLPRPP